MNTGLFYHTCMLAISAVFAMPALAQNTKTSDFDVQIVIQSECKINSTNDLNFGSTGVIDTAIDATTTIAVQCTKETPYDIGLNEGLGTGATLAERLMTGPDSATIGYSLYTAGYSAVWGDTVGTDTVSDVGSGAVQTHTVYGRVPAQTTPKAGTYSDTITVTVTY